MTEEFVIPPGSRGISALQKMWAFARKLDQNVAWRWTVKKYKPTRSNQQNRYLWGVVYPTILEKGGLEGWDKEDVHELFLGEHFGWETLEGLGKGRIKPIKRSSRLSTEEFSAFVDFIQRYMAERGVYIPDANEADV